MGGLSYLLVLGIAFYLIMAGLVFFTQSRMIYYPELPSREIAITPAQLGLAFEEVALETADGERLGAWFIPAPRARATLLFAHGNAGNISHRLDSIRLFHELGLSVLIFDYRGYGQSSGTPSERGTRLDAEAAWRHLTESRGVAPDGIVLFGRSLGAAVVAELATGVTPAALIVESGFTSVPDFGAEKYPWLPVRLLARFSYDTRAALAAVRCPVLVVHSRDDEIIDYRHGQRLFAAAREPKSFLELRGGHNDGFMASGLSYVRGLRRFLEQSLPGEDARR